MEDCEEEGEGKQRASEAGQEPGTRKYHLAAPDQAHKARPRDRHATCKWGDLRRPSWRRAQSFCRDLSLDDPDGGEYLLGGCRHFIELSYSSGVGTFVVRGQLKKAIGKVGCDNERRAMREKQESPGSPT